MNPNELMNQNPCLAIGWCLIMALSSLTTNVKFMDKRHVTLKVPRLCSAFQTMQQNMIESLLLPVLSVMGDQEISVFSVSR